MPGMVMAQSQALKVNISEGRFLAGLAAVQTPYATGGPWAAIPSAASGAAPVTATAFRIRTWAEGTGARVIVFAVQPRTDGTESETQIASFALQAGESREVTATSKYGARPVTVSAAF
jgi:hypothetical protein